MNLSLPGDALDADSIMRGEWEHNLMRRFGVDCYALTSGLQTATNLHHPLLRPLHDEAYLKAGGPAPSWPGGAPFAVCLTHDVDHVSRLNPRIHWRRFWNQGRCFLRDRQPRAWRGLQGSARHGLYALTHPHRRDSLHCYERWLELESKWNASSTFLFLPHHYIHKHDTDGGYRYDDWIVFDQRRCQVRTMMREIHRRGWEVGLHASWTSASDADQLRHQKNQVEEAIQAEVRCVRQHHLHFDPSRTPRVHHEAGIQIDSSIGLNDTIGFRRGTAYPWRLHDLLTEQPLDVWEVPLAIQDRALVETLGCGNVELSIHWAMKIAEHVERVGGCLTLLWHPESIERENWFAVYAGLLERLSDRGAWFGTMGQVYDWWKEQVRLEQHNRTSLQSCNTHS